MTEISVGFTLVTPGSLDPDMHFGLEVKWLTIFTNTDNRSKVCDTILQFILKMIFNLTQLCIALSECAVL